jgi:ABC-2 type transport system permease protein
MDEITQDQTDLLLEIPAHFERDLVREGHVPVSLSLNAINAQKAGLASGYANSIIRDFNTEFIAKWLPKQSSLSALSGQIEVTYSNWYNPRLDYKTFMVPGILGEIVSLIICFLTAMNIVRERELGTIEQLNVTPIQKWQFILGKFIPFWIISLFIMLVGLTVGKMVFDIPLRGSLWLVFGYTAAYMPCVLGLGFLISNFADTQQQAMFTAWFFILIFILMCGLFTPIESMPNWAQTANKINPIAYFVQFMRMVLIKGAGFQDIKGNLYTVLGYAAVVNALAIWTYRKRV